MNEIERVKDMLGYDLHVGDKVLFMQIKYRNFMEGEIKSLASKSALISHEKTNLCATESRQFYDQIISLSAQDRLKQALREKQERENPKPLTLEELREMDGEPVWTVAIGADNVYTCEIIGEFGPGPDNREVVSICGLEEGRYDVFADLYGKTWLAYRNRPKED